MPSVKKCPQCTSLDISFQAAGLTGEYHCSKCGYTGAFILEEDLE